MRARWAVALALALATACAAPDTREPQRMSASVALTDSEFRAAQIRRELASNDLRQCAWGAHHAMAEKRGELVPDLVAALRRVCKPALRERPPLLHAALADALIQLGARVEPADLLALARMRYCQPQVLVLASREPARHVELLSQLCTHSDERVRIAAWNLLAFAAPADAAKLAFDEARIELVVEVRDDGKLCEMQSGGFVLSLPKVAADAGYPGLVTYELESGTATSDGAFAPGPIAIYADRVEGSGSCRGSRVPSEHPSSEYAVRILSWLAGDRRDTPEVTARAVIGHAWTTPDEFIEGCGAELERVRARWHALVDRLVAAQLLERASGARLAPIDLDIRDARRDSTQPLPMLVSAQTE